MFKSVWNRLSLNNSNKISSNYPMSKEFQDNNGDGDDALNDINDADEHSKHDEITEQEKVGKSYQAKSDDLKGYKQLFRLVYLNNNLTFSDRNVV